MSQKDLLKHISRSCHGNCNATTCGRKEVWRVNTSLFCFLRSGLLRDTRLQLFVAELALGSFQNISEPSWQCMAVPDFSLHLTPFPTQSWSVWYIFGRYWIGRSIFQVVGQSQLSGAQHVWGLASDAYATIVWTCANELACSCCSCAALRDTVYCSHRVLMTPPLLVRQETPVLRSNVWDLDVLG